jgi:hypothetical protein
MVPMVLILTLDDVTKQLLKKIIQNNKLQINL